MTRAKRRISPIGSRSAAWRSTAPTRRSRSTATPEDPAREFSLTITTAGGARGDLDATRAPLRAPRVAVYAPWTGGNIDEGWTRWVLEQYEFPYTTIHNMDVRAGTLRRLFDAI